MKTITISSRMPIVGLLINSIVESKILAYQKNNDNKETARAALVMNLILLLSVLCEALLSEFFIDFIDGIKFSSDYENEEGLQKYLLDRVSRTGWEELSSSLCEALLGEPLKSIIGQDLYNRLNALSQHRNLIAHGEAMYYSLDLNTHTGKREKEKFEKKGLAFQQLQDAGIIPRTGFGFRSPLSPRDVYSIKTYEYFEVAVVEFATKFLDYIKEKEGALYDDTSFFQKAANLNHLRAEE